MQRLKSSRVKNTISGKAILLSTVLAVAFVSSMHGGTKDDRRAVADNTVYVNMIQNANFVNGSGISNTVLMRYPCGRVGLWSVNQGEFVDVVTRGVIVYPCIDTVVRKDVSDWRSAFTGDPSMMNVRYNSNVAAKGTSVDLTVTPNVSIYRYHFASASSFRAIAFQVGPSTIDNSEDWNNQSFTRIDNQTAQITLSGGGRTIFFSVKFSVPCAGYGTITGSTTNEGSGSVSGSTIGGYFKFSPSTDNVVVSVAMSHTSMAQAQAYFNNEFATMDFDKTVSDLKAGWIEKLGKVEAQCSDVSMLKEYYTAVYTLYANIFDAKDQPYYTPYNSSRMLTMGSSDFWQYVNGYARCEWDDARQVYQFLALTDPDVYKDNLNTIQAQFNRDGKFYCDWHAFTGSGGGMPAEYTGHEATLAYLLGIPNGSNGIDYSTLLSSLKSHMANYTSEFWSLGYNPTDGSMSANQTSRSLEQYASLKGIGIFARLLGDSAAYNQYYPWFNKYTNLWKSDVLRFSGRTKSGSWNDSGFFEGDGTSYRFMVPQDPYGILSLHGVDNAVNLIETYVRSQSDYNDYKLNYEFLPIFADRADVTQDLVQGHLATFMKDKNFTMYEGLWGGNGLVGQGAFYVDNAVPLAACILGLWWTGTSGGTYLITAPSMDSYVVHGMKDLAVQVNRTTSTSHHISAISLDGKNYPCFQLSAITLGSSNHTLNMTLVDNPAKLGALYLSSSDGEVTSCAGDLVSSLDFTNDPLAVSCAAEVYSVVQPASITLNGTAFPNWTYDAGRKLVTLFNVMKGSYHVSVVGSTQKPGSFNLSSPANGGTRAAINPTLVWSPAPLALSYTLIVDDNNDFSSPIFNQNVGDVTSRQVTGLTNSKTYYWKVIAHNSFGDTDAGNNSFSFTTTIAPLLIEAESMNLTNYIINTNLAASGGNLIKLSAAGVTGTATCTFSGSTGTYDMNVWYFDESDGACTFRVHVGGTKVDEWVANQNLGSIDPVAQTRISRTITGLSIASGAQIKLEAVQDAQEWGRYDDIEIYEHGYQLPIVSITSPANNALFVAGSTVAIIATASEVGGSISKVEFYQGSTKLGESTTSPYSFSWASVAAGSYTLTAKVTDGVGVTRTSNPVSITVVGSQGAVIVNFTTPSDGNTLQNVVPVNARAYDTHISSTDGAGIKEVDFYLLKGTAIVQSHQELTATYDWSLDVAGLGTGDYVLQAKAFSSLGDSAITQMNVHVISNPRPPSNWILTFSDEFNGVGTPDPAKWTLPSYDRRPNSSGPDGYWDPGNAYMDGKGNLVIKVQKLASGDYSSACVSTEGPGSNGSNATNAKFSQTYGKYECKAKLPTQQGWWVAFWMMQGNQGSVGNGGVDGSEVDIMEAWGWTDKINHAIHWDGYGADHQSVGTADYPPGIRNGYHIYTLIWDPDMYYFYIDSVEVWRTTGGGVCNQPGFLQLTGEVSTESWAVDPSWAKDPAGAVYPDSFMVDWVRVYRAQTVGVGDTPERTPTEFSLVQNYPNPFNPSTTISYHLKSASYVTLTVSDMLGRDVARIDSGLKSAGSYTAVFDGSKLASGTYLARLTATPKDGSKPFVQTMKMLMTK
jgi:beta-glucanase (GH16 family)